MSDSCKESVEDSQSCLSGWSVGTSDLVTYDAYCGEAAGIRGPESGVTASFFALTQQVHTRQGDPRGVASLALDACRGAVNRHA
jgi:hypothetical protein